MDYFTTDLTSLHEKLVNKDLSVEELTKDTFKTIKDRDQQIAAFLALNEEAALKQAKELDQNGIDPANVLAGIAIAIKDNIVTKGLRTTAASKMLENFDPIYDATVMEKLAAAQMINVGKVNMDEFAMGGSTESSARSEERRVDLGGRRIINSSDLIPWTPAASAVRMIEPKLCGSSIPSKMIKNGSSSLA
ncbi:aspartyl/glutamyl-tRNA(Asn/Gln) amidotransferase, A subunit, gatA [Pediococcus acidilactici D3]|nr:aspartyl/glutamyl-tRNA(Asn/Gln) amidotransferase, A subunit, gatA [Pediococcus acidilactici D3]